VFPHRRAITVVVVLPAQTNNHPHQASKNGGGERDQDPSVFEQTRRASERKRAYDNEADQRCRVKKGPDQ
jgi:hypothetical protein